MRLAKIRPISMNSTTDTKQALSVAVFARAPVPGSTKTRLIPAVGSSGAASLHKRMLEASLQAATAAGVGPVTLAITEPHPYFGVLRAKFGIEVAQQTTGDLGQRMLWAIEKGLARSSGACVAGSDCPSMTPQDFCETRDALGSGADLVLGPAADGGYYLVAMSRPLDFLFTALEWGGSEVLSDTLARAGANDLRVELLAKRHDIDEPQDLAHLPRQWGYDAGG